MLYCNISNSIVSVPLFMKATSKGAPQPPPQAFLMKDSTQLAKPSKLDIMKGSTRLAGGGGLDTLGATPDAKKRLKASYAYEFRTHTKFVRVRISYAYEIRTRTKFVSVTRARDYSLFTPIPCLSQVNCESTFFALLEANRC